MTVTPNHRAMFSIIVPVFQNVANLPKTIPSLLSLADDLPNYDVQLVLVDDGSQDGSFAVIDEFARLHPSAIKAVKLTRNFGQTPAIQAGLRHASGDCVGIISADLQEPWSLFAEMVRAWERGAMFVMGERRRRRESGSHQAVSSVYWRLVRRFAFRDFPEMGYDFCLLDRQVVDDLNRIHEKNSSIFVLIYWLGYAPVRLPITRDVRTEGRSQWHVYRRIRFTIDTLIGFTYLPARVISLMSFLTAGASLAYLGWSLTNWYVRREAPPGWMMQVGLGTLIGSMILFALGIISEYLLRILDEARRRPPYVVERRIGLGAAERYPSRESEREDALR